MSRFARMGHLITGKIAPMNENFCWRRPKRFVVRAGILVWSRLMISVGSVRIAGT